MQLRKSIKSVLGVYQNKQKQNTTEPKNMQTPEKEDKSSSSFESTQRKKMGKSVVEKKRQRRNR